MVEENTSTLFLNDIQLARTALKDPGAEEALLRRLYPKIIQTALTIVGDRSMADDVAQIAALQILKSLDKFRGEGSLDAWAGRITCRAAIRLAKREQRLVKRFVPISDTKSPTDDRMENELSRRSIFEKLIAHLQKMPWKRRVALLLHLAHGYTVHEVAEITEVSPNTVKDRLRTAYKELRSIMDKNPSLRTEILEEIS